jgi:ribosome-associated protein
VPRLEGEDNGEWIIVDCGAAVAHVMQPAIRDYYHLEEIWGDKPVKMKLDGVVTKLVKASESVAKPAAGKETAAKRAALGKAPAKAPARAPAKKAAAKTSSRSAPSKAPARPVAKKVAAKAGVTRVVGVKKTAAKKAATKPAAKKAPARKTAARG